MNWEKVKKIIEQKLVNLNVDIYVYEPTSQIQEHLIKLPSAEADGFVLVG